MPFSRSEKVFVDGHHILHLPSLREGQPAGHLTFNVAEDPYIALQADIAPPAQRPTLNAVATVVNLTGRLGLSLFLALGPFGQHIPALAYPIVAVVIVATFLIIVATVR